MSNELKIKLQQLQEQLDQNDNAIKEELIRANELLATNNIAGREAIAALVSSTNPLKQIDLRNVYNKIEEGFEQRGKYEQLYLQGFLDAMKVHMKMAPRGALKEVLSSLHTQLSKAIETNRIDDALDFAKKITCVPNVERVAIIGRNAKTIAGILEELKPLIEKKEHITNILHARLETQRALLEEYQKTNREIRALRTATSAGALLSNASFYSNSSVSGEEIEMKTMESEKPKR